MLLGAVGGRKLRGRLAPERVRCFIEIGIKVCSTGLAARVWNDLKIRGSFTCHHSRICRGPQLSVVGS